MSASPPVPAPSPDEGRTAQGQRLHVSEAYLRALGRATYAFACLEWSVLQLMERLEPGYIHRNENDTAGQIAEEFLAAARKARVPEPPAEALVDLAFRFRALVPSRNDLFHAHPFVAENGEERLRRNRNGASIEWTIAEIDETADAYEACSAAIADFLRRTYL